MALKEISEPEARERKDQFKELRDVKKEERDLTVEDKESISSLACDLEFPGFSEAGEQIRNGVDSAGEATEQRFEEQDLDATENVFVPQKGHEEELKERSEGVAEDVDRIDSKRLTTDAAQSELDKSKLAAEQGKEAIDKLEGEQEEEREQGEKDRDDQEERLADIKIEFKT